MVTWQRGAMLILPLAQWAETPYLVLAYIVRRGLRRVPPGDAAGVAKWRLVSLGAFAGVLVAVGGQLFGMLGYHGPGGFAEVVIMTLAMWMFTIPYLLLWSAGGAALGGALGWGLWWVWSRRR
ncbi:hypothetical protein [Acidimangrovimonas pyrenivorans]|uniref:Uncharacterized protein n=1 Tax=Acidimangrovimonas pyrenivorans TaxID=2030798 RepID=A0ABV7AEZ4_9RHOB